MPLINLTRPAIQQREVLEQSRMVAKAQNDNIDRINNKFAIVTFAATHGTEAGIPNPFGDAGAPSGIQIINTDGTLAPAGATIRGAKIAETGQLGVTVNFQPPSSGSGSQGERIASHILSGSAVSVLANTSVDMTSIQLSPGTWDIDAGFFFAVGSWTAITQCLGWVNTASTTDPGADAAGDSRTSGGSAAPTSTGSLTEWLAGYRVTPSVSTIYYASVRVNATSGTGTVNGRISAVRAAPYLTGYSANVTALFFAP